MSAPLRYATVVRVSSPTLAVVAVDGLDGAAQVKSIDISDSGGARLSPGSVVAVALDAHGDVGHWRPTRYRRSVPLA